MRKLAVLSALIFLCAASTAQAGLIKPFPKGASDKQREKIFKINLPHVSYICENSNSRNIRQEHCRATRWIKRELAKLNQPRKVSSAGMSSGIATWYGPGFYGHSTSCGQTLTGNSMWVASMQYGCGTPIVICTRRCISTTVQDTGAFSATFDLAPGLARALGCYCTQSVRWRVGR